MKSTWVTFNLLSSFQTPIIKIKIMIMTVRAEAKRFLFKQWIGAFRKSVVVLENILSIVTEMKIIWKLRARQWCCISFRNSLGFHSLLGKVSLSFGKVHSLMPCDVFLQTCYRAEQAFQWFCICSCSAKVPVGIYIPLQQQVALNSSRYSHSHKHCVKTPLPKDRIRKRSATGFYRCSRLPTWLK